MSYRHGVYVSEVPTSIVPPVSTSAGLPVVFGTAPVHLALEPVGANKPVLCYTYNEAVKQFGYHKDWGKYTLCEFIKSHFALFNVAPVVFVNVLDPETHKKAAANKIVTLQGGKGVIESSEVIMKSLGVKKSDNTVLKAGVDYHAAYNEDGYVVISRINGGGITEDSASLTVSYNEVDPSLVDSDNIVGGIDWRTGKLEGLELVNSVFPYFRLVPGLIVAPGWSQDPTVAAVMAAKADNINGHFKALALTDIPTDVVKKYNDVPNWKNQNNYMSNRQVACWPKVKLGDDIYHLSTQAAGVLCSTDADNDDVPYVSPSNHNLQANGAVLADGTEVFLDNQQANYLNGEGVVTALNFIGGWKLWGNRTAVYPSNTDPKDAFIAVRRMFDWQANTFILTYWQKVDAPVNRRLIETVVDSENIRLNGLAAREFILGGRVEFQKDENPLTDLMNGIIKFHTYITPPAPAREIDNIIEYDPKYLQTLFE